MIGLALALVAANPPLSYYLSGEELLKDCTAPAGSQAMGVCIGYVLGVADAATLAGGDGPKLACPAANVTSSQLRDAVIAHLRANESRRSGPALPMTIAALRGAFPCS